MYFSGDSKSYIYDLSLTIFTSILLYLFIDDILERHNKREELKKLNIIIGKIKPSINKFYNIFVSLYAGMSENPVKENSEALKNIFYEKDKFYKKIIDNLKYHKNSSFLDISDFNYKSFFNGKEPSYLTWQKFWMNSYLAFYKDLTLIQMHYSVFFSSKLLFKLEALVKPLNEYILKMQDMSKIGYNPGKQRYQSNKDFYEIINLKEVMISFEDFLKCLEEESNIKLMTVDINDINNRNTAPRLGELLK